MRDRVGQDVEGFSGRVRRGKFGLTQDGSKQETIE